MINEVSRRSLSRVAFRLLSALLFAVTASFSASAQLSTGYARLFNDGWKFALCTDSIAPATPCFDDSAWRALTLPHDWSIEGIPSPTLNSCTGYLPGGMGWYRKHFSIADTTRVRYILFEGVYNRSEVYLNGNLLGKRPNGYISFYYDVTPYLKPGDNVLAVKVDHTRQADSRWYSGSGIYRDVYLVEADPLHFEPWAMGWKARDIRPGKSATLDVEFSATATVGAEKHLRAVARLTDAAGKIVARGSKPVVTGQKGLISMKVAKPAMWQLDNPALYTLELKLEQNGTEVDSARCRVGFRTLDFDADKGFFLNKKNVKVKGVCLHHDAGVLGAVVPRGVWQRRLQSLKDIGVNAIRMSHNPQAPVVYDLCDEMGLLVMDEASDEWEYPKRKWVSGWNVGTPVFEGSYDFFEEWIDRDVADMVRRDRNHPSVAFWSIGNEVDYPNDPYSHPVLDDATADINQPNYGGYNPDAPSAMRIGEIARRLAPIVRAIDDSRPVTGALAGVVMSNRTAYPDAVDIVGYNYTENRYLTDHKLYPGRVIYGSENGHSYDAWLAVRDNDHIFGQFLWTGTDYLGEAGAWPSRGLGTGLLDFGSFLKPRGKFRASLWSPRPVAYLGTYPRPAGDELSIDAPDVWNYEDGEPVRVVCYTNAEAARLTLDGRPYGELKERPDSTGIIRWDVAFAPGALCVEALDADGNVIATDTIHTSGRPYALRAVSDIATIESDDCPAHITVEVVDEQGRRIPLADNMISCTVEGPVTLLGLEGTGNTDMSAPRDTRRRASSGRVLAYIGRAGSGDAGVRFTSPLLKSAEVVLKSK